MKKNALILIVWFCILRGFTVPAQWSPVLEDVVPVKIAVSPNYHQDQTVYVVDDEIRIWISETGGASWTTVYEGSDPNDPEEAVLDIVVSPNFSNDNAIIMIHKDGTVKLSPDRGQHWLTALTPDGVSGVAFSPRFADDLTMYCITGVMGPVNFYKSENWGASWGEPVAEITIGGGFYSRVWANTDVAARDTFAIQYEPGNLYMSFDGGETWLNSFLAQTKVSDFVFSPSFSEDSIVFVADAADIYKNARNGDELYWVNKGNFPGAYGIRFAISPSFITDRTIFAAVDQVGIIRSTDYGETWGPFNEGFGSILPISIAISDEYPYTLFAGSMGPDGAPDKVWRYQSYTGTMESGPEQAISLAIHPNPGSGRITISFDNPSGGHCRLCLHDISGRLVGVILDANKDGGHHSVQIDNSIRNPEPGIYVCTLEAGGQVRTAKLILTGD